MGKTVPKLIAFLAVVALAASCTNPTPVNLAQTNIDAKVATIVATQGKYDPDTSHRCSPATPPAPVLPSQWWSNLAPRHPAKMTGNGVVGYERWRNLNDSCQAFRQDLYRTAFTYDLTGKQFLKGLVTKAELSFSVKVLPATKPGSSCQAMTGGGGSLFMLRPGFTFPLTAFSYLGVHLPPQPFPSGSKVFGMLFPWLPGQIAAGITTYDGGGQRAVFTVDVTDRLNGAINRGDAEIGFMLSGSEEDLPQASPSDSADCRTVYQIQGMVITHY